MPISEPKAGELNKRISLVRRTDYAQGDSSAYQEDELICTVWAKFEPTGSAYWGAVQTEEKATHRFYVRAIKNKTDSVSINHGVLVKYLNRFYRPTRVTDANGEGKFTIIECQELGEVDATPKQDVLNEALYG